MTSRSVSARGMGAPEPAMPQNFITTSWDDGHPLDFRIAEMLARHGLTGTFYIPRKIDTGVMSEAQVRDLSSHFEVGAHTLNHVFLADTDAATAQAEIAGSKKWVEDVTGKTCLMFCPPAGRFNSLHEPMFRSAGYVGIRTVEFISLDPPRAHDGLMEMPTTIQAHPQPAWNYVKNLIKRVAVFNAWRYIVVGRGLTNGGWLDLARRLLDQALLHGGVFHLWGHSWEIEQAGQWEPLERVLAMLGQAVRERSTPCLTNGDLCLRGRQSQQA